MDIPVGTKLGPYEIVAAIGAGGMGQVYKARDTRLDRTVAVKVVPADLAADPEFRQRFDREAKVISQLNHPNICTLHDVGEERGIAFLVLEYLEGDTLAQRLSGARPLPIAGALSIAIQIADALDKAHKQGIVHRDLKPANIILAKAGAKLLDFGLAKTGAAATPISAQLTTLAGSAQEAPLTARGTILGTFQYMAPEQIEGGDADARTDIWAFGCVLYEMLTGRRAFEARSQMSVMGAILAREPTPISELQPIAPPALARVVRTCLAKNPDDRFQSAHDLWLQLQWIQEGGSAAGLPAPVVVQRKRRDRALWIGIAAAAGIVAAGLAWWLKPAPPVRNVVTRFQHWLPEGQNFTRTGRHLLTISPDGTKIVYVANQQLYLRTMDQLEAQPIRGTNEDPLEPVFSPDGQWVAYGVQTGASLPGGTGPGASVTLKKISMSGGPPITLGQVGVPFGASWRNGLILIGVNKSQGQATGIQAIPDSGGPARMLVTLDSKESIAHPLLVGDGKHVVFVTAPEGATNVDEAQIVLQNVESGARKVLVNGGTDPRLLASGQLVYIHAGALLAVPFDTRRLEVTGSPTPILEGVDEASNTWSGHFAISSSGTLAFRPGTGVAAAQQRTLVWVDRQGNEQPIPAKPRAYQYPRLSPDGTRIAVNSADEEHDVWMFDLKKDILSRLTFGAASEVYSPWMPGGQSVIYTSGDRAATSARDLFRKNADGTGTAEQLTTDKAGGAPMSVSPDGKMLVSRTGTGTEPNDLMLTPLDGSGKSRPLLADPKFNERNGEISPDGRWIAYDSNESGRTEVFVRPFPNVDGGRWQVSSEGGAYPAWSRSGRELFFASLSTPILLMSAAVQTATGFTYERPQRLFDVSSYYGTTGRTYDVDLEGKRFLLVKPVRRTDVTRPSIVVISHWIDDVRARMSPGR